MPAAEELSFAGIDVSALELSVALRRGENDDKPAMAKFRNNASGHKALLARLIRGDGGRVRVCMEASGNHGLDLALTLHAHRQVEISVVNPRRARRFAESLGQRSKTDPVDARVLCQYAARMPFTAWQPPSEAALRLRAITRTIMALTRMNTQQKNRQHALSASAALPALLERELDRHIHFTEKRMLELRRAAVRLMRSDAQLLRRWQHLQTIPGMGENSSLAVLGELAVLPETMDERQWVAHSGLDPKHHRSGSSIEQQARISKAGNRYLRAMLFMPALVAVQHDPALG